MRKTTYKREKEEEEEEKRYISKQFVRISDLRLFPFTFNENTKKKD
jgi:hypothetical protein